MCYNVQYRNAVLYFRSQEGINHNTFATGIAARTFTLLASESSEQLRRLSFQNALSGSYMPLSSPVEAILTIWQTLQIPRSCRSAASDFSVPLLGEGFRFDSRAHSKILSLASAENEASFYSPTDILNTASIWSSVRLFIYAKAGSVSVVLHPAVWSAIQDNLQTSTVVPRGPPLRPAPISVSQTNAMSRQILRQHRSLPQHSTDYSRFRLHSTSVFAGPAPSDMNGIQRQEFTDAAIGDWSGFPYLDQYDDTVKVNTGFGTF